VRKILAVLSLAAAMTVMSAAPALAAVDCNTINKLLHIDNVRDCNNN